MKEWIDSSTTLFHLGGFNRGCGLSSVESKLDAFDATYSSQNDAMSRFVGEMGALVEHVEGGNTLMHLPSVNSSNRCKRKCKTYCKRANTSREVSMRR